MDGAINAFGIVRSVALAPSLQGRIFSEYLIANKRPDIHDYISGKTGVSLEDAQRGLAQEGASFGDPDKGGASHYGGANHASITLERSAAALHQMRDEYLAFIGKGVSPHDAWKAVTSLVTPGQVLAQEAQVGTRHQIYADAEGLYKHGEKGAGVLELVTSPEAKKQETAPVARGLGLQNVILGICRRAHACVLMAWGPCGASRAAPNNSFERNSLCGSVNSDVGSMQSRRKFGLFFKISPASWHHHVVSAQSCSRPVTRRRPFVRSQCACEFPTISYSVQSAHKFFYTA
jgi:hypothetical protein